MARDPTEYRARRAAAARDLRTRKKAAKPGMALADVVAGVVGQFLAPEARAKAAEERARIAEELQDEAEEDAAERCGDALHGLLRAMDAARGIAFRAHARGTFLDPAGNSLAAVIGNLLTDAMEEIEVVEPFELPAEAYRPVSQMANDT